MTNDPAIMHDQPVTGNDPQRLAKDALDAAVDSSIPRGMTEQSFYDWRWRRLAENAVPLAREVLRIHQPDGALVERVARALAGVACQGGPDVDVSVDRVWREFVPDAKAALAALTGDSA